MDCSLPSSSIHGIFQARILEWGAIAFSRRSSRPRDWTRTVGRHFTSWATREVQTLDPINCCHTDKMLKLREVKSPAWRHIRNEWFGFWSSCCKTPCHTAHVNLCSLLNPFVSIVLSTKFLTLVLRSLCVCVCVIRFQSNHTLQSYFRWEEPAEFCLKLL